MDRKEERKVFRLHFQLFIEHPSIVTAPGYGRPTGTSDVIEYMSYHTLPYNLTLYNKKTKKNPHPSLISLGVTSNNMKYHAIADMGQYIVLYMQFSSYRICAKASF